MTVFLIDFANQGVIHDVFWDTFWIRHYLLGSSAIAL